MIMPGKFNNDVEKEKENINEKYLLYICINTRSLTHSKTHTYVICLCFCFNNVVTFNLKVLSPSVYVYIFHIAMNNVWKVSIIALRSQLLTRTHTHTDMCTCTKYTHKHRFHNVSQHKIGFTFFVYLFVCLFVHSAPSSSCFALLHFFFSLNRLSCMNISMSSLYQCG